MIIYCEDCKKKSSVNLKWFNGICPQCYSENVHDYDRWKMRDMPREFIDKAHEVYDGEMVCPKCRTLLTGLHMMSNCYQTFIRKAAYKLWREYLKQEKKK